MTNINPWQMVGMDYHMRSPNAGTAFFVDGENGLDTNDGLSPASPLLTVTAALALVTSGANDYIFILNYPSTAPATEVFPIVINASHVHLIGVPDQASRRNVCLNVTTTTENCIEFGADAADCEIAGIEFGADSQACIYCDIGTPFAPRMHIHHCEFGWIRACEDGISIVPNADTPHWYVHDNRFGENCSRAGIYLGYNSTRSIFQNNQFMVATGAVGFWAQGLCTGWFRILDNDFLVTDQAAGEAITLTNANCSCYINRNYAGQGKAACANNPYLETVATFSAWIMNYSVGAILNAA